MTKHRVLVFGGRDYADSITLYRLLDELVAQVEFYGCAIITGGARGADSLAHDWANLRGHPAILVPANWTFYSKAAGNIRNGWMFEFCFPTYGVAFPGGVGTANMRRRLVSGGVPVWAPYEGIGDTT